MRRDCAYCNAPLPRGRRSYCSRRHAQRAFYQRNAELLRAKANRPEEYQRLRLARIRAAVLAHPRCFVCDKPIEYGKSGVSYNARTCSRPCAKKRWDWMRDRAA